MSDKLIDSTSFYLMLAGHGLFIIAVVSYSLSWIFNYSPGKWSSPDLGGLFLSVAILTGIFAVMSLVTGVSSLSSHFQDHLFKIRYIVLSSLIFFIAMLLVTTRLFHRFLTSELFLIVFWAAIEFCAVLVQSQAKWLEGLPLLVTLILMFLTISISMVCYTIHYRLEGFAQFINGLIPLAAIVIVMGTVSVFLLVHKLKS